MKRFWMLLLVVLMLCLTACGDQTPTEDERDPSDKGSKPAFTQTSEPDNTEPTPTTEPTEPIAPENGVRPSDNLLHKDLQDRLTMHLAGCTPQTVSEFAVVLSQTEEKSYVASLTVMTQSVYADFTWTVEVGYTKYDQGWVMTDCNWREYSYEVVRYPGEDAIRQLLAEQGLAGTQQKQLLCQGEEIQYVYDCNADWSAYATGSGVSAAVWNYDAYSDQWKYKGTENRGTTATITEELAGTWELHQEYGLVTIQNVTETGFDVDISTRKYCVSSQHFVLKDARISQEDGGKFVITFTNDRMPFQQGTDILDGAAEIVITLPKSTTETLGETCDFAMEISIFNKGGLDHRVYGSYVIGQASKVIMVDYFVQVRSAGGMALPDCQVMIFLDKECTDIETMGSTDQNGNATFTLKKDTAYYIKLYDVALKGYDLQPYYEFNGTSANITLTSAVIRGESVTSNSFELGDVMYDFTFTDSEGNKVTLSEVLAEKDMVMLNFWYVDCSACQVEFPVLQQAYERFSEDIEILALNSYPEDYNSSVASFKEYHQLTFPMGKVEDRFNPQRFIYPVTGTACHGYPTSVFIDRYGVICLIEVGAITGMTEWSSIFAHFTGDDYVQKLVRTAEELITRVPPVDAPPVSDIADAFNGEADLQVEYRWDTDPFAWPFLPGKKEGQSCIYASNSYIYESYAILYADVTMKTGEVLAFDYWVSSEKDDFLYVVVDNVAVRTLSGQGDGWQTAYCWTAGTDGVYELALCYQKDRNGDEGDDTVYLKNLRTVSISDVDTPSYLPRLAADKQADGSYRYVDVYLNQNDGYYHVGSVDGPLLLAGLYDYTQFCQDATIYAWAVNGEIIIDGRDSYQDFSDYFSAAANSSVTGWCTVTEELAGYLKMVADVKGYLGDENEWLLMCKYYDAYGTGGKQMEDPVAGLQPWSALTATEGVGVETNHFYYDGRPIMPRGKLARFTPVKSGVYRITSRTNYTDFLDAWILDEGRGMLYEYIRGDEKLSYLYCDSKNVTMVFYMEAGKNYYINIAPYDVFAVCDVWFDIAFLGESYQLFRSCSPNAAFRLDENGNLVCSAIDVALNPATGYYHEVLERDAQGNPVRFGSIVYADFMGATPLFANAITAIISMGGFDFSLSTTDEEVLYYLRMHNGDQEATLQFIRNLPYEYDWDQVMEVFAGIYHGFGKDETETVKAYLNKMITGGAPELEGCVPVDAQLMRLLQSLVDKYSFDGVENAWQKMCVYYNLLAATEN